MRCHGRVKKRKSWMQSSRAWFKASPCGTSHGYYRHHGNTHKTGHRDQLLPVLKIGLRAVTVHRFFGSCRIESGTNPHDRSSESVPPAHVGKEAGNRT